MSQLHQSLITPLPGIDLTHPTSAILLKQSLSTVEFVAQKSNLVYAMISLKPGRLIYTCEAYATLCNIKADPEKNLPLNQWLNSLTSCSGIPLENYIGPLLQELSSIPFRQGEESPVLVFDFCLVKKGMDSNRIQHQIRPVDLQQKSPEVLFFCSVQHLDHLPPTFSHSIKLMHGTTVLKHEVFSPPFTHHPLLQNLSATERKVFNHIYLKGRAKDINQVLNMAPDTVKSHKSHILHKTGFSTIDALLSFIKREMGK